MTLNDPDTFGSIASARLWLSLNDPVGIANLIQTI
jgi:hypothetical protein